MKNYIILIACTLILCGCKGDKEDTSSSENAPKESVAADSKWDFFLLGSWKYTEQAPKDGKLSPYPQGIETFFSNGEWSNHTMTAKGEKVLLKGTWRLDDKDDYTLWVIQTEGQTAEKKKKGINKIKYVVASLEPGKQFIYMAGDCYRTAEYVQGKEK